MRVCRRLTVLLFFLQGLPCRGQRTKNNARTRKGKAKGPITGKKVARK